MRKYLIVLAGPLLGCLFFGIYWNARHKRPHTNNTEPVSLKMSPGIIIGTHTDFRGNPGAPYTLVEFADYQCPPCRSANTELADLAARYGRKLRFTFRNYPLSFHPQAMPAALMAEAARQQGKFWEAHDVLYRDQNKLSTSHLDALASDLKLDKVRLASDLDATAKGVIAEDKRVADSFKLSWTPTFVLCGPDNQVVLLKRLDQVQGYIK